MSRSQVIPFPAKGKIKKTVDELYSELIEKEAEKLMVLSSELQIDMREIWCDIFQMSIAKEIASAVKEG
jgi:hypothetical protein